MGGKSTPPFLIALYVGGMLLFGSLNTVTIKIQLTLESVGYDATRGEHIFQKPWYSTFNMFLGMAMAMWIQQCCIFFRCKTRGQTDLSEPLADTCRGATEEGSLDSGNGLTYNQKVVLVFIPAGFDLLATGLCAVGMMYIPASVWQMLRGAEIIFAAILAVTCLKRKMHGFNYLGLFLCVVGITCVGTSNVLGGSASPGDGEDDKQTHSQGDLILGMGLVILGQVVQAAQVIAEEWLLKDLDLDDIKIIGYEGVWGLLMMTVIIFPLLWILPGNDGGRQEDPIDALYMIRNSSGLVLVISLYLFSCATYNVTGIAVTGALSAVHRTMLEASRTCIIWVFGLAVHCIDENSPFGEFLTPYSWLQLLGFVVLLFGQAVYGEMVKLPFLTYPPSEPALDQRTFASPGMLKSFGSPLPPKR